MDFSHYKQIKWFNLTINTSYKFNIEKFLLFVEDFMNVYGIALKKIVLSKMYMTPYAIKIDDLLRYTKGVKAFIEEKADEGINYNYIRCVGKIGRNELKIIFSPTYNGYNVLCNYTLDFLDIYCRLDSSLDEEIIKKLEEFVGEEFIIESHKPTNYM